MIHSGKENYLAMICGGKSMTSNAASPRKTSTAQLGFSLIEAMIVVAISMILTAIAIPNIIQAAYSARLRSSAGDLSGLMQQARILAAKNNTTYPIRYTTLSGNRAAYVDLNLNGAYDSGEPVIYFPTSITPASGAPTGSSGQPAAYVLVGDTGAGAYDNTNALAYSSRGLPCLYDAPPTCTTPAAKYFGYYLTQTRPVGPAAWAAVIVTKAGRSKVVTFNGATWN
jgi:type IV fimbrial biogenesis protein FimT